MGGGGHQPKCKHDYTENVKILGWRGRGVGMENFWKKTLEGWGSKMLCNPTPMYDIKWNSSKSGADAIFLRNFPPLHHTQWGTHRNRTISCKATYSIQITKITLIQSLTKSSIVWCDTTDKSDSFFSSNHSRWKINLIYYSMGFQWAFWLDDHIDTCQ